MLRFALVCFVVVCFVVALPAMADDGHGYAVGSCKPRFTSFPTISAAVSSVPAGSTILVCPGTYPEQVMISQPVTLINLSVDGTGSDAGCAGGTWVAGIFYAPGSSGTVSRARASGQMNSGCGAGIWAENDGVSNQSVDVGESSVHDVSNVGVFMAESGNAPTFWVRVHGNTVNVPSGLIGIAVTGAGGVVSGNGVSNALFGIASVGSPAVLSSNDVRLSSAGIALEGGGPVSFNRISNTVVGILFFADGGNLQGNRIVSSSQAGVEFSCFVGSARNNVISDTQVGLDQETAGFDAFNSFDNTVSISTSCATPLAVSAVAPAAVAPTANTRQSIWQWRTPASPTAGQR